MMKTSDAEILINGHWESLSKTAARRPARPIRLTPADLRGETLLALILDIRPK